MVELSIARSLVTKPANGSVAISEIFTVEPQLLIAIICDVNVWPIVTDVHESSSGNPIILDGVVHVGVAITWTRNWTGTTLTIHRI